MNVGQAITAAMQAQKRKDQVEMFEDSIRDWYVSSMRRFAEVSHKIIVAQLAQTAEGH